MENEINHLFFASFKNKSNFFLLILKTFGDMNVVSLFNAPNSAIRIFNCGNGSDSRLTFDAISSRENTSSNLSINLDAAINLNKKKYSF